MIDLQTARLHVAFGSLLVLGLVLVPGDRWLIAVGRRIASVLPGTLAFGLLRAQGCVRGDVPRARATGSGSG